MVFAQVGDHLHGSLAGLPHRRIEGLSGDAAFELPSSVVPDPVDRRAGERIALETGATPSCWWVCADGRANEAGGPTDAGRRRAGASVAQGRRTRARRWLPEYGAGVAA